MNGAKREKNRAASEPLPRIDGTWSSQAGEQSREAPHAKERMIGDIVGSLKSFLGPALKLQTQRFRKADTATFGGQGAWFCFPRGMR